MFVSLYQRAAASYPVALAAYRERVQAGTQPWTRFVDLFNVEAQESLLTSACVTYIVLAGSLYMHMQASLTTFSEVHLALSISTK
jgi:hypothetical protein